jgi:hypothetical protein
MTKHRHPATHDGCPDGSIQGAIDQLRKEREVLRDVVLTQKERIRELEAALRDVTAPALRAAHVLEGG